MNSSAAEMVQPGQGYTTGHSNFSVGGKHIEKIEKPTGKYKPISLSVEKYQVTDKAIALYVGCYHESMSVLHQRPSISLAFSLLVVLLNHMSGSVSIVCAPPPSRLPPLG